MSDFFTKKQRKFWCDTCRIFIEYTKMMIEQHNRSKIHLRNANADTVYKNTKAKFMNNISKAYRYQDSFGEQNQNLIGNKSHRVREMSSTPNVILEEIKREQYRDLLKLKTQSKNFVSRPDELNTPTWSLYLDENTNSYSYMNNTTGLSQLEKPPDYDGPLLPESTLREKGEIGKWEVVEPGSKEIFGKRRTSVEEEEEGEYVYMPGILTAKGYYRKLVKEENEDEELSSNVEENDHGDHGDHEELPEILDPKENQDKNPKDEYSLSPKEENEPIKEVDKPISLTITTKKKFFPLKNNLFSESED